MTGKVGARDPALVNDAPAGHRPSGFDPARIARLREGSENLRLWMNSVIEQRKDWQYPNGVEVNARDALECAFRVSQAVIGSLNEIADILDPAIATEAGTAATGTGAVHEGSSAMTNPMKLKPEIGR